MVASVDYIPVEVTPAATVDRASSGKSSEARFVVDGSDMSGKLVETKDGFVVNGQETLKYEFRFVSNVFDCDKPDLAAYYQAWGRCLAVIDQTVYELYELRIRAYFAFYDLKLDLHPIRIGEKDKTVETMLKIEDKLASFGLIRKEPVLVIGGGLITDVCGFACAAYKRSSNFIRIPTTLIGLIDAAVAIKVGVNHGKLKNRLGAYHAPIMTFLDFDFLATLPESQIRNGTAELIKIAVVGEKKVFDLLNQYGEELITTRYGHLGGSTELRHAAQEICYRGIKKMLELESGNLHEIMLDRVIAFGHTWSPTLELTPAIPLRHGHAINIDMAFSTTLALMRDYITEKEWERVISTMSRVGLALDHELFEMPLMLKATESIKETRDGKLRAAVPRPVGECFFVNDLGEEEMETVLRAHKLKVRAFPRNGDGIDVNVDAIDVLGADHV